jgi:hypothetical protein
MKIQEISEYKVWTTEEENAVIRECSDILGDILSTMTEHNCDTLDYGYPDNPQTINIRDIQSITHILFNLEDIHTMY